jgi:methyltransferase (TIGR00027 family)
MPEVVQSARWVAAQRVRESERTDRLFFDPLAPALSGDEGMAALKLSEKYNPRHEETANYIAIRTRFFDDVAQADATAGTRQIVLPAAGMDARAYRISWPGGTTLYEIDHPQVLAAKEEILQAQHRAPECKRITIGADLTQDWIHGLLDSGFRSNERSTWLIEGLFYYLDEPAVNRILKDLSRLAAPGSVLVTDLVSRSLLTAPWMQQALKAMEEQGMGWRFGTDDPVGLFAVHGWDAAIKDPGEEGARYDSQRFPVQPRSSWSFFVLARRM